MDFMMNNLPLWGGIFFVLTLLLIFLQRNKENGALSYHKQPLLFSPAERSFLGVLELALGDNYRVYGKVRIADVLKPSKGSPKSHWQKAFKMKTVCWQTRST